VYDGDFMTRRQEIWQFLQSATCQGGSPDLDHHGPGGVHVR
jgi:hypothetical protein